MWARVCPWVEHGRAVFQHGERTVRRECPQPSARVQSSHAFISNLFEVEGFLAAQELKSAWLSSHTSSIFYSGLHILALSSALLGFGSLTFNTVSLF